MKLVSSKLGEIEYTPESVIHFNSGLIGLEKKQNFLLLEAERFAPFSYLQSTDDPDFTLIVINPFLVDPNYSLEMLSEELDSIDAHTAQDFMALSIVILSPIPEQITVNLKAPLLVNNTNKQARQVLMISDTYGVNDPLIKSGIAAQYKSNPPEKLD